MQRDVHHVARLEADVVALVPPQQVVVEIERRDDLVQAPDLDLAHVGARRDSPRRVQRRDGGPQRADLIGARLRHLARDVDLVRAHAGDGRIEVDGRIGATELRVDSGEPIDQDGARALERQIGQVDLADLRHDDEPLARHLELVRLLDPAGEHERDHVPGAHPVRAVDGTGEQGQELRRGATEDIDPKHIIADGEGLRGYGFAAGADDPGIRVEGISGEGTGCDTESLKHAQHLPGGRSCGRPGLRGAQVGVQQIRGITGGCELGADLVRGESRLLEPLAEQGGKLRVLLQQLGKLVRGDSRRQPTRKLGLPLRRDLGACT